MEVAMNNGFCEITEEETEMIQGGFNGWTNLGYALGGTVVLAATPILLATGHYLAAVDALGYSISLYASIES